MIIKNFNSMNYIDVEIFFNYLSQLPDIQEPAVQNIWHKDWKLKNNTLPYLLTNTQRFVSNGEFNVVYLNNQIVAFGGVYQSDFSNLVGIAGVRTYVDINFRHQSILRETLLPHHRQWCIDRNLKIVALTFNEYNKNLIRVFQRRRLGEKLERTKSKENHHLFFKNINELEFPVSIQNTKQFILYEKLHENFDYNWNQIKFNE